MKIEKFVTGIASTNCYLVINEDTKEAVLIDPAACPSYMLSHVKSKGITLKAILLTHGHFDHILGIDAWLKEEKVPVYIHEKEKELLSDPQMNLSIHYGDGYSFCDALYVKDQEIIKAAGLEFLVIYTPGHTIGGACYYLKDKKVLFCGDTLFYRSMGRTDFPTGNEEELVRSIKEKLFGLPDDTQVYPGHMSLTTIGDEKRIWGIA